MKDQEILDEPDLPEPDKPEPFEEGSIRDTVKAKAMEIRRRPGNYLPTPSPPLKIEGGLFPYP